MTFYNYPKSSAFVAIYAASPIAVDLIMLVEAGSDLRLIYFLHYQVDQGLGILC